MFWYVLVPISTDPLFFASRKIIKIAFRRTYRRKIDEWYQLHSIHRWGIEIAPPNVGGLPRDFTGDLTHIWPNYL